MYYLYSILFLLVAGVLLTLSQEPSTSSSSSSSGTPIKIRFNGASGHPKCEKLCIPLDFCFELFKILENPSPQGLASLKDASCGFSPSGDPLVWCKDAVCERKNLLAQRNGAQALTEEQIRDMSIQEQINQALSRSKQEEVMVNELPTPAKIVSPGVQGHESDWIHVEETRDNEQKAPSPPPTPRSTPTHSMSINDPQCGYAFPGRISGGASTAKGEYPWLAAISIMTSSGPQIICGGAVISDEYVITAAHCVSDSSHQIRNISHVRLGAYNISNYEEEGAENIEVSKILFHPQFRERPVIKHDIALLKLKRPASIGPNIGSICLPEGNGDSEYLYEPNKRGTIAGWRSDGSRPGFSLLQKVEIPIVAPNDCKRQFYRVRVRVLTDLQVCAGSKGRDSCKGDSGGPLMMRNPQTGQIILVGLISYGSIACDGRLPGVYTKVNSYMDWIREIIKIN